MVAGPHLRDFFMEINVVGRHIEVTSAIRDYAETKAAKLPRYYDRIQGIELLVGRADHHHRHEVEIIATVDHADPFVAKVAGDDLYACIDETVDKMERQLTDHKERLRNHKHHKP